MEDEEELVFMVMVEVKNMSQRNMEYNRQDRTWLPSTNLERRSDIKLEMPPELE